MNAAVVQNPGMRKRGRRSRKRGRKTSRFWGNNPAR
jgi:hypothetical protein